MQPRDFNIVSEYSISTLIFHGIIDNTYNNLSVIKNDLSTPWIFTDKVDHPLISYHIHRIFSHALS